MADQEHRIQRLEKKVARLENDISYVRSEFDRIGHRLTGIVEKKLDPLRADVTTIKQGITRRGAFMAGAVAAVSIFWTAVMGLMLIVQNWWVG